MGCRPLASQACEQHDLTDARAVVDGDPTPINPRWHTGDVTLGAWDGDNSTLTVTSVNVYGTLTVTKTPHGNIVRTPVVETHRLGPAYMKVDVTAPVGWTVELTWNTTAYAAYWDGLVCHPWYLFPIRPDINAKWWDHTGCVRVHGSSILQFRPAVSIVHNGDGDAVDRTTAGVLPDEAEAKIVAWPAGYSRRVTLAAATAWTGIQTWLYGLAAAVVGVSNAPMVDQPCDPWNRLVMTNTSGSDFVFQSHWRPERA